MTGLKGDWWALRSVKYIKTSKTYQLVLHKKAPKTYLLSSHRILCCRAEGGGGMVKIYEALLELKNQVHVLSSIQSTFTGIFFGLP